MRDNYGLREIHVQQQLFTLEVLNEESYNKLLYLNHLQLELLELTPGEDLILQVGAKESQVVVATQSINPSLNTFYLSNEAFEDFDFYQGEILNLVAYTNKKLVLGSSIGLTISFNTWKNIEKRNSIEKRAKLALEKGILFYCFILNRVDWENNLVKAYCLNPMNHQWVKKIIPVPQVILDRGSYPGPKTIKSFSSKGKVENILWINSTRTFGKWETFLALSNDKKTNIYLPETTLFTLPKLEEYLEKYMYCYIKSNYGRSGRQVFRIGKEENLYICKTGGSEVKSWQFDDLISLCSFLYLNLGKNLILQQGIFLAQIDNGPFDMRVLAQKNAINHWVISALNFRIAKPGAIVTNFSAGARDVFISPGEEIFYSDLTWDMLEKFTKQIIEGVENYFGRLGEVGLDVALDRDGKLWLLEANSRPSSMAYREADQEACRQIYGLPLDYGVSLIREVYRK